MNTIARPLLLELSETTAHTREIALTVAGFEIRGQLALEGAALHLEGHDGHVTAQRLVITTATITGHGVRLSAQQLEAARAVIGWGSGGLHIEAARADIRGLQVIGDEEPVEGTLLLDGIALTGLVVHGHDVRVGGLRIAKTEADAKLLSRHAAPGAEPPPASAAEPALVDQLLSALDRLTGHVNVDLGLDLSVPVIGRRRATHHFRIPIEGGTLDYRRLENNLSTLEDALLDFSVRDEGLVLEVGIPFLPTRGKGKPIVTWPLGGADVELARQQRVRLSVLARPGLGNGNGGGNSNGNHDGNSDGDAEERSSPVAVRDAQLDGLDVRLAVAPADASPLRRLGSCVLAGEAAYVAGEPGEAALVRVVLRELVIEDLHVAPGGSASRDPDRGRSVQSDDAFAQ